MLSFLPSASTAGTASSMFEEDFLGTRARSFPGFTGHHGGFMASPAQAFPFAGFPVHPSHDPMGLGESTLTKFYEHFSQGILFVLNKLAMVIFQLHLLQAKVFLFRPSNTFSAGKQIGNVLISRFNKYPKIRAMHTCNSIWHLDLILSA